MSNYIALDKLYYPKLFCCLCVLGGKASLLLVNSQPLYFPENHKILAEKNSSLSLSISRLRNSSKMENEIQDQLAQDRERSSNRVSRTASAASCSLDFRQTTSPSTKPDHQRLQPGRYYRFHPAFTGKHFASEMWLR